MKIEQSGLGVVLLGSFNPKIFQPAWFAAQKLIRDLEAEEANTEVIHNDITVFSLEWFKLEVTRERFFVSTEQEAYFEILMDFVLGTFSLLSHTPVGTLGINTSLHYRVRDDKEWHAIGDKLAPKEPWKDILKNPGLRRLEMEEPREGGPNGVMRIKIEPSRKFHPGIYINVNDHYVIENPKNTIDCKEIIKILGAYWDKSVNRSKKIAEDLLR